ncbi:MULTISPECIES: hypothetical protein [Micromonospora]|uniref:hypothetical protein n=1 Tax=Micromonospora TaxID=1873 RepID=UPI000F88A431|nr:hypothetical protein [Verrucosispora sp. FIM060022]RUL90399.1 hypothetical protein EG812_25330 [Verrucosispora sp. FIM060022]
MERKELISLLADESPVNKACREALERGAPFHIRDEAMGLVPANNLASTYRAREAITRDRGIPTLGFAAAVEALHALGEQPVRLGGVTQLDPPYYFQLFLTADATSVLTCIGVNQKHQQPIRQQHEGSEGGRVVKHPPDARRGQTLG